MTNHREREAVALLQDAGYVVLPRLAVADLRKRIAAVDALVAATPSHEWLTALSRVVGYLEAFIGQPARPGTDPKEQ